MIKISHKSKVYVHAPAGVVTGGAELLHQLVDRINTLGIDAYIVYFGTGTHIIPEDYSCYNIKTADTIEDSENNIEVIYEGVFDKAFERKQIQKILWWLSVDNFFICSQGFLNFWTMSSYSIRLACRGIILKLYRKLKYHIPIKSISFSKIRQIRALHAYQSEYAHKFLLDKGIYEVVPLKDFINLDWLSTDRSEIQSIKEDLILYNPKKDRLVKHLKKAAPHLKWVALTGYTRNELQELIKKAKVYIDFGYHPGKDRLPRECAMSGCCVICGEKGSAAYYEDVPIPSMYKFKDNRSSIPSIIATIEHVFANYDSCSKEYTYYRNNIKNEYSDFNRQVANIFYFSD